MFHFYFSSKKSMRNCCCCCCCCCVFSVYLCCELITNFKCTTSDTPTTVNVWTWMCCVLMYRSFFNHFLLKCGLEEHENAWTPYPWYQNDSPMLLVYIDQTYRLNAKYAVVVMCLLVIITVILIPFKSFSVSCFSFKKTITSKRGITTLKNETSWTW